MRALSNIPWASQSEEIKILPFGSQCQGVSFYDYVQPFAEWLRERQEGLGRIDLLLFYLPEVHQLPNLIHGCPIPTVAILSDWNLNFSATLLSLQIFDYVLVDKRGFQVLRRMGFSNAFEFNPYGLHIQEREWKQHPQEYSCDVLFIGNMSPGVQKNRGIWLRRLLALRDKVKIRVATQVFGEDYVQAMRSARVVFNRSIRGEANMRVFETLAMGGVVFLEQGNLEILNYLEPEKECKLYADREMESTLLQLLGDESKLDSMRTAAQTSHSKWNGGAHWSELARKISLLLQIPNPKKIGDCAFALEWLNWTVPVRKTPVETVLANIDARVESEMGVQEAKVFLARCVLVTRPSDALLLALEQIYTALKSAGQACIWSQIHFAQVLEKGSERSLRRELQIWEEILESVKHAQFHTSQVFPFYVHPCSRHSDFQNALWNQHCPGALDNMVDLRKYMIHWALHRIGELALVFGDNVSALKSLRAATTYFEHHAPTWIRISECTVEGSAEFLQALERAFEIDPMNPEIGVRLLLARRAAGDTKAANSLQWELAGLFDLQCTVYPGSPERDHALRAIVFPHDDPIDGRQSVPCP